MDVILVVNAGSSSLKFQVFETDGSKSLSRLVKGYLDGIGSQPRLRAESGDKAPLIDRSYSVEEMPDLPTAIHDVAVWLQESQKVNLIAVGHRVVHGGPDYHRPVLVDRDVVVRLTKLIPLAPLHQPNNLAPIQAVLERRPKLPQVACFDTAFHRGHNPVADHYAIPEHFYGEGVRRYGFHGLSYEYIAERLKQVAPSDADGRVIVAHLGSGTSMCALLGGRSVETTMGFTALDGIPMGTRPGQLDPGIVLYLIIQKGMDPEAAQDFLYRQCGLKGLSGIDNDMRTLQASNDPRARLAIDHFAYRTGLHAGMLAAAIGGLDAFVFTAGIGEKSPTIRALIADKLAWLGARLDPTANDSASTVISRKDSRVALYVLATDEELMIARHTLALLSERRALAAN